MLIFLNGSAVEIISKQKGSYHKSVKLIKKVFSLPFMVPLFCKCKISCAFLILISYTGWSKYCFFLVRNVLNQLAETITHICRKVEIFKKCCFN